MDLCNDTLFHGARLDELNCVPFGELVNTCCHITEQRRTILCCIDVADGEN